MAHKITRQGYFFPTISRDALEFVKKYDKYQYLAPIINTSLYELNPITASWHFAKGGVDLIGPTLTGRGAVKFTIVAVDYFTKWAKAEPLVKIIE